MCIENSNFYVLIVLISIGKAWLHFRNYLALWFEFFKTLVFLVSHQKFSFLTLKMYQVTWLLTCVIQKEKLILHENHSRQVIHPWHLLDRHSSHYCVIIGWLNGNFHLALRNSGFQDHQSLLRCSLSLMCRRFSLQYLAHR